MFATNVTLSSLSFPHSTFSLLLYLSLTFNPTDVKLLHALVSIAAALKLSAIKHPLESRDINELYDKVDASLRECMNSTSMDVPLNVMKILRDVDKDEDEAIIVRQALAFVNGPLQLCIAHDLTGLLGTAQISTHGEHWHCFYSPNFIEFIISLSTSSPLFYISSLFSLFFSFPLSIYVHIYTFPPFLLFL